MTAASFVRMNKPRILRTFAFVVLFFAGFITDLRAAKDPLPPLAADAGRLIFYRDAVLSPKLQPALLLNGIEIGLTNTTPLSS